MLGGKIHIFDNVTSTQDESKRLCDIGNIMHGDVVIAKEQQIGRGKVGKSWISPSGGLYMTIALRPQFNMQAWSQLSYVAGVSVCEAIAPVAGSATTSIKWVNDVMLDGKKACGILLEIYKEWLLVGIGINVKSDTKIVEIGATSLEDSGIQISVKDLCAKVVNRFATNYDILLSYGFVPIRTLWMHFADGLGRDVVIESCGTVQKGIFVGVHTDGDLQLLTDSGVKKIKAGDMFFS